MCLMFVCVGACGDIQKRITAVTPEGLTPKNTHVVMKMSVNPQFLHALVFCQAFCLGKIALIICLHNYETNLTCLMSSY